MLDAMEFKEAVQSWDLPQPGFNQGYRPEQLIEQIIVNLWCAAARFPQADITRLDGTLVRLLDWGYCRRQPTALEAVALETGRSHWPDARLPSTRG
jgi:hypothetical protein